MIADYDNYEMERIVVVSWRWYVTKDILKIFATTGERHFSELSGMIKTSVPSYFYIVTIY